MSIKDLQKMLAGAMRQGVKTVKEFCEICSAKKLATNEQRFQYFTK